VRKLAFGLLLLAAPSWAGLIENGGGSSGGVTAASSTTFTGSNTFTAPTTFNSSVTVNSTSGFIGSITKPLTVSSSGTFTVGLEGDSTADTVPGIYGSGTGSGTGNYGVKGNATGSGTNYAVYATVGSGGAPSYAVYGIGTTTNANALRIINGTVSNVTASATGTGGNFNCSAGGQGSQTCNGIVTNGDSGVTNYGIQSTASGGTNSYGGWFSGSGATNNYGVFINGGPLNIQAQAAPTAGVQGDIWNDSTQHSILANVNGSSSAVPMDLFTMTVSSSVNTTLVETSILGSTMTASVQGIGTLTLPANFCTIGKTVYLVAVGTYTDTGTPDLAMNVYLNNTKVLGSSATLSSITGNDSFTMTLMLTCRTTGTSGTIMASGQAVGNTSLIGSSAMSFNSTLTTINTTLAQTLIVTVAFNSNSASDNLTFTNAFLEVHN
jgi:hypothetical protein